MIKIDWYPLRERYNIPLNGDFIPVEQENRITGWTVKVNSQGYFWATNHDFGDVEGTLQSSVTATHQYVLTDFMSTVKYVPLSITQHISSTATITSDTIDKASTGLVEPSESTSVDKVIETTVWDSSPILDFSTIDENPEEVEVIYSPLISLTMTERSSVSARLGQSPSIVTIDDPVDELVEDKLETAPPVVLTPSRSEYKQTRRK